MEAILKKLKESSKVFTFDISSDRKTITVLMNNNDVLTIYKNFDNSYRLMLGKSEKLLYNNTFADSKETVCKLREIFNS